LSSHVQLETDLISLLGFLARTDLTKFPATVLDRVPLLVTLVFKSVCLRQDMGLLELFCAAVYD